MLRISRLTDYGTVVMAYLANNIDQAHNAKDVAEQQLKDWEAKADDAWLK